MFSIELSFDSEVSKAWEEAQNSTVSSAYIRLHLDVASGKTCTCSTPEVLLKTHPLNQTSCLETLQLAYNFSNSYQATRAQNQQLIPISDNFPNKTLQSTVLKTLRILINNVRSADLDHDSTNRINKAGSCKLSRVAFAKTTLIRGQDLVFLQIVKQLKMYGPP